jgi:hypothetical protein
VGVWLLTTDDLQKKRGPAPIFWSGASRLGPVLGQCRYQWRSSNKLARRLLATGWLRAAAAAAAAAAGESHKVVHLPDLDTPGFPGHFSPLYFCRAKLCL